MSCDNHEDVIVLLPILSCRKLSQKHGILVLCILEFNNLCGHGLAYLLMGELDRGIEESLIAIQMTMNAKMEE